MDNNKLDVEAYKTLKEYRRHLTRQQIRTLAGQIKAGQGDAAMNGLAKILDRQYDRRKENMQNGLYEKYGVICNG